MPQDAGLTNQQFEKLLDFMVVVIDRVVDSTQYRQQVLAKLEEIKQQGDTIMAAIDDLTAKVEAQTTVIGSAVTLLNQLKAMLDAAGTDPVKLAALSKLIGDNTDALSSAVVANTPPTA